MGVLTKPLSSSSLFKSDLATALPNIAGNRTPPRAVNSCEPLTCNRVRATASTKSHSSAARFFRGGLGGPPLISPLKFAPSIYANTVNVVYDVHEMSYAFVHQKTMHTYHTLSTQVPVVLGENIREFSKCCFRCDIVTRNYAHLAQNLFICIKK